MGVATAKTHRFPVEVRWLEGKLTLAAPPGKQPLAVATPPEFNGGVEGIWSPEDLFVASVASCFTVTLVSAARRHDVPLLKLVVDGSGAVSRRPDGAYGFVSVDLEVELETAAGRERDARAALDDAERTCLVAVSLDTPVDVRASVTAAHAAA